MGVSKHKSFFLRVDTTYDYLCFERRKGNSGTRYSRNNGIISSCSEDDRDEEEIRRVVYEFRIGFSDSCHEDGDGGNDDD